MNLKLTNNFSECLHELAESRGGPLRVEGVLPVCVRRRPDALHPRAELCRKSEAERSKLCKKRQSRIAQNERPRQSGQNELLKWKKMFN